MASEAGPNRPRWADKGKATMVEEDERPTYSLNELQDQHRTRDFTQEDGVIGSESFRFRQHHIVVPWNHQYTRYLKKACLLETAKIGYTPQNATILTAMQEW